MTDARADFEAATREVVEFDQDMAGAEFLTQLYERVSKPIVEFMESLQCQHSSYAEDMGARRYCVEPMCGAVSNRLIYGATTDEADKHMAWGPWILR